MLRTFCQVKTQLSRFGRVASRFPVAKPCSKVNGYSTDHRGFRIGKQEQLANLGGLVSEIQAALPSGLEVPLRNEIIHNDVCFRLLPESSHVKIRGRHSYQCTIKLLQLYVRTFYLPPGTVLEPLFIMVTKDSEISDRRLEISWRSQLPVSAENNWRARPFSTNHKPAEGNLERQPLLQSLRQTGKSLLGQLELLEHEYPVLAGTFEFAFNHDCDQIILHTIRDVEYLPRPIAEAAV